MTNPFSKYAAQQSQENPFAKYAKPKDDSFSNYVGDVASERGSNIIENFRKAASGEETLPEALLKYTGEGLGGLYDVAGEGVSRVASAVTPDFIEEPIKRGTAAVGKYVMDSPAGDVMRGGAERYKELEMDYPRAMSSIGAVGNIMLAKPILAGSSAITKAPVKTMAESVNTKTILPSPEEVKDASRALYTKASELGGEFSPNVLNEVVSEGKNLLPKGNVAGLVIKPDEADVFIGELSRQAGQKMTLDDFESIDRFLGEKAHGSFMSDPSVSRKYSNLQGSLRESIQNPNNIIGSPEGVKAQQEAVKLWGIQTKMGDIARIINDAEYYDVPATAIKTGFRRIARNDKLMRGYSDTERKAIRRAAKSGSVEGLFKTFGSRLMAIIGGTAGGAPGAAIGYGVSGAGRTVSEAMKRGQAGQVSRLLGERSGLARKEKRISREQLKDLMKRNPKEAMRILKDME